MYYVCVCSTYVCVRVSVSVSACDGAACVICNSHTTSQLQSFHDHACRPGQFRRAGREGGKKACGWTTGLQGMKGRGNGAMRVAGDLGGGRIKGGRLGMGGRGGMRERKGWHVIESKLRHPFTTITVCGVRLACRCPANCIL